MTVGSTTSTISPAQTNGNTKKPKNLIPLTSFDQTPQNIASISFLLGCLSFWGFYRGWGGISSHLMVFLSSASTSDRRPALAYAGLSYGDRFSNAIFSPELGLYCGYWALFRFLEYTVVATVNTEKVTMYSFLLPNHESHHLCNLAAVLDYIFEETFFPTKFLAYKHNPSVILLGVVVAVLAHLFRLKAIVTAAKNFQHTLGVKEKGNTLVTHGVYNISRHPSYLGFFWWNFGCQLLLCNVISFPVLVVIGWTWIYRRIQVEEGFLIDFFGEEYLNYKKRVSTLIPFMA